MKTVVSLTVNLLCVCGNDLYFRQQTTLQKGRDATRCNNVLPARTSQEGLWKRPVTYLSIPSTGMDSLAMILLHKSGKQVELLDFCSKDYCLQFFLPISRKNFLEGHNTTHAYSKINCLYRNLWVNIWVTGRTTLRYLRIHVELLTLNHNRVADFRTVVSVSI